MTGTSKSASKGADSGSNKEVMLTGQSVLERRFPFFLWGVSRQRLVAALQQAQTEIDLLEQASNPSAYPLERSLLKPKLDEARNAARRGYLYQAWDLLQQLERLLAFCQPIARQRLLLSRYRQEAKEKLHNWRASHVAELVDSRETREVLMEVMETVHQASQNQQQKIELARQQIMVLLWLFLFTLPLLLLFALAGGFDWLRPTGGETAPPDGKTYFMAIAVPRFFLEMLTGMLVGFFGGLLSVAFASAKPDMGSRIPFLRSSMSVQLLRPFLGAAVAMPVILFTYAGLIELGDKSGPLIIALCFVAGFSERWFIQKLDAIADTHSEQKKS